MNAGKIKTARIKAAGANLRAIGYTMIVGMSLGLIRLLLFTHAKHDRDDADSDIAEAIFFAVVYLVCSIIITVNIIRAGRNLSSCEEEDYDANPAAKLTDLAEKFEAHETRTGELAQGGFIVYTDEKGEHGLICADADLGQAKWADAHGLCSTYRGGNFSDWRLPDKDELLLICSLLHRKKAVGGFVPQLYWSSNDQNTSGAWGLNFGNSQPDLNHKTSPAYVRAVRTF